MKIILDTNIWYDVDNNPIFKNSALRKRITVTFLNYFELIKKPRIITDPNLFRRIFRKMDEYEKIFEPPFVYIAKLHKYYHYNVLIEQKDYINFLVNFKKGDFIDPAKESYFREYVKEINKDFENLANTYNEEALNVKAKIKNNRKHLDLDSSQIIKDYLFFIITHATKQNLDGFDFNAVALLSATLDIFFKKLEVGELIMKTNDIIDYMILSYVQPGDQYYTKDKKWITLISESNNSHYLYKDGT